MRLAAWSVLATPWGPAHIATTDTAVVALALRSTDEEFCGDLRRRGFDPSRAGAEPGPPADHGEVGDVGGDEPASRRLAAELLLARVRALVERYAEGDARALDEAIAIPVDLTTLSAWDRAVLSAVRRIPAGAVTSYGRVARAIGRTGAARAVGGAVGRNPVGLLIPCHRVIAGDGTIGGYGGSWFGTREENLELKRRLLEHEDVILPADMGG